MRECIERVRVLIELFLSPQAPAKPGRGVTSGPDIISKGARSFDLVGVKALCSLYLMGVAILLGLRLPVVVNVGRC